VTRSRIPSFESVSTWQPKAVPPASATRTKLLQTLSQQVINLNKSRIRVAVDGYTASGKTSFAVELAATIRSLGRPTLRATLDDFKKPWRDSIEQGYDRVTAEGYYRNAPDFASAQTLLLEPAGSHGSGKVALCAYDPLTGVDHRAVIVNAPDDAVLIVDSVFAFRPEYNSFWDFRIWLDVSPKLSLERGIRRDADQEGFEEAERLHRDRYHAAEKLYIDEVSPMTLADVIIDNTDFANPELHVKY